MNKQEFKNCTQPIEVIIYDLNSRDAFDDLFTDYSSQEWFKLMEEAAHESDKIKDMFDLFNVVSDLEPIQDLFRELSVEKGSKKVLFDIYENRMLKRTFNNVFFSRDVTTWIEFLENYIYSLKESRASENAIDTMQRLLAFFRKIPVEPKEVIKFEQLEPKEVINDSFKDQIIEVLKSRSLQGNTSAIKLLYELEKREKINHIKKTHFNV